MPQKVGLMKIFIKHSNIYFKTISIAFFNCISIKNLSSFRASKTEHKIFVSIINGDQFKTLQKPQNLFELPYTEENNDTPLIISSGASEEILREKSVNFSYSESSIDIDSGSNLFLPYLPFFTHCSDFGKTN